MLPINEFLLWNNCNNNCKFCWQRTEDMSSKEEKLLAIQLVKEYLRDLKNSHTLFVGGELFCEQDSEIKYRLYDLFQFTVSKMLIGELDLCYINTNILYDMVELLFPVLNLLKKHNLLNKVHFTTSGDDYGRFNAKTRKLFYKNLHILRKLYPDLMIIVNLILTKDFCEDILEDKFHLGEYVEKYGIDVNTIPYIKYGEDIKAPSRELVFKTLYKLDKQKPGYLLKYCNNFLLGQDIILHKYVKGQLLDVTSRKSICGHSENFTLCYSDSDKCFICDCDLIRSSLD